MKTLKETWYALHHGEPLTDIETNMASLQVKEALSSLDDMGLSVLTCPTVIANLREKQEALAKLPTTHPEFPTAFTLDFRDDRLLFYFFPGGPWRVENSDEVKAVRVALEALYEQTTSVKEVV